MGEHGLLTYRELTSVTLTPSACGASLPFLYRLDQWIWHESFSPFTLLVALVVILGLVADAMTMATLSRRGKSWFTFVTLFAFSRPAQVQTDSPP
jgi:hypothetical protein